MVISNGDVHLYQHIEPLIEQLLECDGWEAFAVRRASTS